jgi:hypothetical protein
MRKRSAVVAALLVIGAIPIARAQDVRPDANDAISKMRNAKSEEIKLGPPAIAGEPTDLTFRLTVTIEDKKAAPSKALDTVFNSRGELVSVETSDKHLAEVIKNKQSLKGNVPDCYGRCSYHLRDGNAPKYAVCFYSCLAEP